MILRHPSALLLLPLILLAVYGLRNRLTRGARLLRLALLTALMLALAEPLLPGTPAQPPLLVLVDQSGSLPPTERAAAWAAGQQVARARHDARTVVGAIGAEVVMAEASTAPTVDPAGTNLGGALRLARGWGGRTLLLSDGGATDHGVEQAIQELRGAGVVVDVVPLRSTPLPDAQVTAISLPAGLRQGQQFAAEIVLTATAPIEAELHLLEDGVERSVQTIQLPEGRTVVPFSGRLTRTGVHTFEARIEAGDAQPDNNSLAQWALVGAAPRVLVIERSPDTTAALRDTLEQSGIQSEARRPADLSSRLSDLERFDAIILNDVPATELSLDQQATLREYVRSLGHGLLALGGPNSFGLGEYRDTPLEAVLPVEADPPPRRERQQIALLLIIDRSASMYGRDPRTSKLELAKSAAIAATQALVPDDRIGVLVFDTESHYVVPMSRIGEGANIATIQNQIAQIEYGGGTDIYGALATGLPDLAQQDTVVKHAVLLTDGVSYSTESYDQLVADARAAGITLSTIAIGNDADLPLLEHLAGIGKGRYHFAADPQDLPRLTLQETEIVRTDPRVEGTLQPQVETPHAALRGLVPRDFPSIGGYVATTPKPQAETLLQSPEGDALLTAWQFGLGRALAWTSDSGEEWAPDWQRWTTAPLFWSQLLAYTFPDPSSGPLMLQVTDGPTPELVADAFDVDGKPLDLADVGARITRSDGSSETLRLAQVAPGRYRAPLAVDEVGAYTLDVALRKGATELTAATGYVERPAAEWTQAPDPSLLQRITQTTGGELFASADAARQALRSDPPRPERPLWPWLVALALALWVWEIAIRRGVFRRAAFGPRTA